MSIFFAIAQVLPVWAHPHPRCSKICVNRSCLACLGMGGSFGQLEHLFMMWEAKVNSCTSRSPLLFPFILFFWHAEILVFVMLGVLITLCPPSINQPCTSFFPHYLPLGWEKNLDVYFSYATTNGVAVIRWCRCFMCSFTLAAFPVVMLGSLYVIKYTGCGQQTDRLVSKQRWVGNCLLWGCKSVLQCCHPSSIFELHI